MRSNTLYKVKIMDIHYKEKDLISFQVSRRMTRMNVDFLIILEDLVEDNVINQEFYSRLRKKCLDNLNYNVKEMETFVDKFEIKLK